MIFFDEYHIFFHSWAFVGQLRPSSKELGNRLQTPTLIGCKFLMIRNNFYFVSLALLRSAKPWIMTQFLRPCQTFRKLLHFYQSSWSFDKNAPLIRGGRFLAVIAWRCPTFTRESALSSALTRFTVLFGMGRSGTKSLWSSGITCCHLDLRSGQPIYRANQLVFSTLKCDRSHSSYFWMRQLGITSLILRSKL